MSNSRSRNWVFTLNNFTSVDVAYLSLLVEESEGRVTYICWGEEVGEEGTPHLQGYLELKNPISLPALKKMIGINSMHFEQRRGTQKQAVDYCKKDGVFKEFGSLRKERDRTTEHKNKILPFMDLIKAGKFEELASHPDCSAYILRHARDVYSIMEAPRDVNTPLNVRWYWGPTGTGKTRRAWYEANQLGGTVYIKSGGAKWFDGYDGEENVIFDDLRSSWFEFSFLLKLLDRYPCRVETKGGSRQWKAVNIWITCPMKPEEMYSGMQSRDTEYNAASTEEQRDQIGQLLRRVHTVEFMPMTPFGGWTEPTERALPSPVKREEPEPDSDVEVIDTGFDLPREWSPPESPLAPGLVNSPVPFMGEENDPTQPFTQPRVAPWQTMVWDSLELPAYEPMLGLIDIPETPEEEDFIQFDD